MTELLEGIASAIEELDEEKAIKLTEDALARKLPPEVIINDGITKGIRKVGDRFSKKEYFLAELIQGGKLGERCIAMVAPYLPKGSAGGGKVVIGTVKGDLHNIGKNLVALSLQVNGFEVHDLGIDVPTPTFLEEARKVKADLICLSSLMITTMAMCRDVIKYLEDAGVRKQYIVMVGGGATSVEWAKEIGADGWAADASRAAELALELMQGKTQK